METKHKYITVSYELFTVEANGEKHLVEKTTEDKPFVFYSGFGMTLDRFEEEIVALNAGAPFDFTLKKDKAYGDFEEDRVVDLDKEIFSINGHFDHENIRKGAFVPLQNEDGNHFMGHVLDITDDKVKMDLNHPLAGKDLNFKGSVKESRDATDEEIQRLISHLSGEGCGCGCSDCGDDCGCGEEHNDAHHDSGCGCGHCH